MANFSASPSCLPRSVLQRLKAGFGSYETHVTELSHRSSQFRDILRDCDQALTELLEIPPTHTPLIMPGGATSAFAGVAMNLAGLRGHPLYLTSGYCSERAAREAKRVLAGRGSGWAPWRMSRPQYDAMAALGSDPKLRPRDSIGFNYVYYCSNDSVSGIASPVPAKLCGLLVADFTSNLLSERVDLGQFDAVVAGGGRSLGPPGVCLHVINNTLLRGDLECPYLPSTMSWAAQHSHMRSQGSQLSTPPTYAIYVMSLVAQDLLKRGGAAAAQRRSEEKARMLYECIDASQGFYVNEVSERLRSKVTVPFRIRDRHLETSFLERAERAGLLGLQNHLHGGMRACLYDAVTAGAVRSLVGFMKDFMSSSPTGGPTPSTRALYALLAQPAEPRRRVGEGGSGALGSPR